jgi:hypothetical protein
MAVGSTLTDKIVLSTNGADRLIIDKKGLTTATSLVATTADISGGTTDATNIKATTAGTASFTTLPSLTSVLLGSTTGNAITLMAVGSALTDKIALNTSTAYRLIIDKDGLATVISLIATTADIHGGKIEATNIWGPTTAGTGSFTTLPSLTSVLLGSTTGNAITLMAVGSALTDKIVLNTNGAECLIIDKDGLTTVSSVVATTADIKEGTTDATNVGETSCHWFIYNIIIFNICLIRINYWKCHYVDDSRISFDG